VILYCPEVVADTEVFAAVLRAAAECAALATA
jgi:hypothetical protein